MPGAVDVVGVYTVKNVIPCEHGKECPPITVRVRLFPNEQDTFHLNSLIGIVAEITGGTPPYNPVEVVLESIGLRA